MQLSDDDFKLFELPRRFALDEAELDTRRRALQAQVHPDRFAADGSAAQRLATQWAMRVNAGYRRLKDPLSRAAYLCELQGQPVDAERNTAMPAEFLIQQMQWRESLEESSTAAEVRALEAAVTQQQSLMLARLATLLDHDNDHAAAAAQLRALMFVSRFRQDIDRSLDRLDPQR